MWLGAAAYADGVFKVSNAGALVATSATITGTINATAGYLQTLTLGKTGVVSGTLTLELSAGTGDTYIASGKHDFDNTDAGFILGIDDSDSDKAKFYIGDSSKYLNWTGTDLVIGGAIIETGNIITNNVTQVYSSFTGALFDFSGTGAQTVQTVSNVNIPAASTGAVIRINFSIQFQAIVFGNTGTTSVEIKRGASTLATYTFNNYLYGTAGSTGYAMLSGELTDAPGSAGDYSYTIVCTPSSDLSALGVSNRSLICTVYKNKIFARKDNAMKTFIITEQQAQTIANYLIEQPFKFVVGLIGILQSLPEAPTPPIVNDKGN
jgi:hypothetical protein